MSSFLISHSTVTVVGTGVPAWGILAVWEEMLEAKYGSDRTQKDSVKDPEDDPAWITTAPRTVGAIAGNERSPYLQIERPFRAATESTTRFVIIPQGHLILVAFPSSLACRLVPRFTLGAPIRL